jgi:hypothetical protein
VTAAGRTGAGLGYRIPGLGWRISVGALGLIPMVLLLVGLPAAALAFVTSHGVALPITVLTVTVFGVVICALATARYVAKPTWLFGMLAMATAAVTLAYLWVILGAAAVTLSPPNSDFSLRVDYRELIELALLVPGLSLASGLVTALEDLRSPQERLPFDFPP